MTHREDLALALELADIADLISLSRFRAQDLHVETKPDASPVTDADLAEAQKIGENFLSNAVIEDVVSVTVQN